jgi:hypothetical protein
MKQFAILATILCGLMVPTSMRAQSGDTDVGELAAFGGGAFGIGTHPVVGASSGLAFSKHGMALIEVAFSPLGSDTLRQRTGPPVESSRLYDFNGSFHIRFPVRERWAPYGIVGGGLLFDSFRAVLGGGGVDPDTGEVRPGGAAVAIDEFNFGFHTGAGLRYHVGQNWGVRPEFKVIISNRTYTRFTVGIFYNLPAAWH